MQKKYHLLLVLFFVCASIGFAQPFRFILLDQKGAVVSHSSQASCILDQKMQLIWEVKQGESDLRFYKHRYSWFDSMQIEEKKGVANGVESKFCDKKQFCNTEYYQKKVNQKGLCGLHQWRLPTRFELQTLIRHRPQDPLVNIKLFPHTVSGNYWTKDLGSEHDSAFDVPFFAGSLVGETEKVFAQYVRLVHKSPYQ